MALERFSSYRTLTADRINAYFDELDSRLDLPWWSEELTSNFRSFSTKGKLVRGSLLLLAYELFNRNERVLSAPVDAAAALEIFQAAILIQDDIMDRDEMRRGEVATHIRLAQGRDAHTGESLAVCLSDCGFFSSYDLLAGMDVERDVLRDALRYYSFELTTLGLSQMEDVALAASSQVPERSDIERVLVEKSGRYSFSLPLVLGAIIAKAPEQRDFLDRFGELVGLIFQIKDDELSLFGSSDETGKPIGNDIREGKKTLFWYELVHAASSQDRQVLERVYGNRNAGQQDIDEIMSLIERYGVRDRVLSGIDPLAAQIRDLIEAQGLPNSQKDPFFELLEWNLSRSK